MLGGKPMGFAEFMSTPEGAGVLGDSFGALAALGRGEQFQSRAPQLLARLAQRREEEQRGMQMQQAARKMGLLPAQEGFPAEPPMAPAEALADAGMYDEAIKAATQAPAARKTIQGADGYNYYTDTGERVLPNVVKPQGEEQKSARSKIGKLYQDYRDGFIDQKSFEAERMKILNGSNGITVSPDGTVQIGGAPKKYTEQQSKHILYGDMLQNSGSVLKGMEGQLDPSKREEGDDSFNPSGLSNKIAQSLGPMGNYFQSKEYQKYLSTARVWSEAWLRLLTGAAATNEEVGRVVQTYFAQPGDHWEVIQHKQALRDQALASLDSASGGIRSGAGSVALPQPGGLPTMEDLQKMSTEELQSFIKEHGG